LSNQNIGPHVFLSIVFFIFGIILTLDPRKSKQQFAKDTLLTELSMTLPCRCALGDITIPNPSIIPIKEDGYNDNTFETTKQGKSQHWVTHAIIRGTKRCKIGNVVQIVEQEESIVKRQLIAKLRKKGDGSRDTLALDTAPSSCPVETAVARDGNEGYPVVPIPFSSVIEKAKAMSVDLNAMG
jgi:hypothetical protein